MQILYWASLCGSVIQNLPANAGDRVLILGWGESLKKEIATHSSILAWEIPRTEKPGSPQGCKELDMT